MNSVNAYADYIHGSNLQRPFSDLNKANTQSKISQPPQNYQTHQLLTTNKKFSFPYSNPYQQLRISSQRSPSYAYMSPSRYYFPLRNVSSSQPSMFYTPPNVNNNRKLANHLSQKSFSETNTGSKSASNLPTKNDTSSVSSKFQSKQTPINSNRNPALHDNDNDNNPFNRIHSATDLIKSIKLDPFKKKLAKFIEDQNESMPSSPLKALQGRLLTAKKFKGSAKKHLPSYPFLRNQTFSFGFHKRPSVQLNFQDLKKIENDNPRKYYPSKVPSVPDVKLTDNAHKRNLTFYDEESNEDGMLHQALKYNNIETVLNRVLKGASLSSLLTSKNSEDSTSLTTKPDPKAIPALDSVDSSSKRNHAPLRSRIGPLDEKTILESFLENENVEQGANIADALYDRSDVPKDKQKTIEQADSAVIGSRNFKPVPSVRTTMIKRRLPEDYMSEQSTG